ncbi:hypothetical protein Tco_0122271 [Tanacetum coccineum]
MIEFKCERELLYERMSNKKRSSTRSIRVPIRFGDSIHGIRKKNIDRNKQNEDDLIRKGDDDQGKVMGETKEMVGISSENSEGFVGDLNIEDFPELRSQVNIPSSSIRHVNIDDRNKNVVVNMMNACDIVNETCGNKENTIGINVAEKTYKVEQEGNKKDEEDDANKNKCCNETVSNNNCDRMQYVKSGTEEIKKTGSSGTKFANIVKTSKLDNNLVEIPTVTCANGDEVVVFDEELVEIGSRKWVNIVCGVWTVCRMQHEFYGSQIPS